MTWRKRHEHCRALHTIRAQSHWDTGTDFVGTQTVFPSAPLSGGAVWPLPSYGEQHQHQDQDQDQHQHQHQHQHTQRHLPFSVVLPSPPSFWVVLLSLHPSCGCVFFFIFENQSKVNSSKVVVRPPLPGGAAWLPLFLMVLPSPFPLWVAQHVQPIASQMVREKRRWKKRDRAWEVIVRKQRGPQTKHMSEKGAKGSARSSSQKPQDG